MFSAAGFIDYLLSKEEVQMFEFNLEKQINRVC